MGGRNNRGWRNNASPDIIPAPKSQMRLTQTLSKRTVARHMSNLPCAFMVYLESALEASEEPHHE